MTHVPHVLLSRSHYQFRRDCPTYSDQQGALLDQVQHDATHNGFLSGAEQVRERRKASRMYLVTYGAVAAMTTGGLSYMATLAGMDGALSVAGWLDMLNQGAGIRCCIDLVGDALLH